MSSMIKYGHYYISAAILVAGAVWLSRPGDPRVMGEDTADIFEQVQEILVVPYLTGTQLPDWEAANAYENSYPSNSIYSPARYLDIQKMANRIRTVVTKSDAAIFWTDQDFTSDTVTLALSYGSYRADEESAGIQVDELNAGGWAITNRLYRYTTNTFSDAIITTATRLWTNSSLFEATMTIDNGAFAAISLTNLPIANNVFGRGAASGLAASSGFHTPGSWWPFAWSYSFPWEQWSYPTKSRVTVFPYSGSNVSFTNVAWVATNALAVSLEATTNGMAGYAVGSLMDVNGNLSVQFAYVQPPPASSPIYLYNTPGGPFETDYSVNKEWSDVWYVSFRINKDGIAGGQALAWEIAAGDYLFMDSNGGGSAYEFLGVQAYPGPYLPGYPIPTPTNSLSILKIWVPTVTNVAPIYVAISVKDGTAVKTNAYFEVTSDIAAEGAVTGSATANAVASGFTATDDRRITTNKLNEFAQVLTNLNRTVYIGGLSSLSCTGQTDYVSYHSVTNYVEEYLGDAGETPSYYDTYTKSDFLADVQIPNVWQTNQSAQTAFDTLYSYHCELLERGQAGGDDTPSWSWWSLVEVNGEAQFTARKHTAVTPVYPSLYAITNGMVKSVKVYAVIEAQPSITIGTDYYDWDGLADYYSHNVSGEYWHQGNLGATVSNITLSAASHALDATRTKGLNKRFLSYGNLGFTDQAVFNLIYQTNNPTEQIRFDLGPLAVTHPDITARHAYFDWETVGTGDFSEGWQYHYNLTFFIKITRVLIVVDWDFRHLGRGFTPANNTPAWRP